MVSIGVHFLASTEILDTFACLPASTMNTKILSLTADPIALNDIGLRGREIRQSFNSLIDIL